MANSNWKDPISLGSLKVNRLIAGTNAVSGFSHGGAERTLAMIEYFTAENTKRYFASCEAAGIDGVVARADSYIMRLLGEHWREGGRIRWIAQTAPEHRDPGKLIAQAKRNGASAIYIHGGVVDRAFRAGAHDEIRAQIDAVRREGLPVGMAAHNSATLLLAQEKRFPVDFFMVCMYALDGYRGNQGVEVEENFDDFDRARALEALSKLDRPCIAYKILAAGRKARLEDGLRDVASVLRPTDGVLVGMFPPDGVDLVRENAETFFRFLEQHGARLA